MTPLSDQLAEFSGAGSGKLRPFEVPADVAVWEVRWRADNDDDPNLSVRGLDGSDYYEFAGGARTGATCVYETGRFYLDLNVNGSWSVEVWVLERGARKFTPPEEPDYSGGSATAVSEWEAAAELEAQTQPSLRTRLPPASGVDLQAQLDALTGLPQVKRAIQALRDHLQLRQERIEAGLQTGTGLQHLVFTGNPGTGKTTVARLVGKLYASMGLLRTGHFVEADRSTLVAGYIGQTAQQTSAMINKALGGVLFIDEAYLLTVKDSPNDFGSEAIGTLMKAMEDHRDDLVVIVAGYPTPMAAFLGSNPGLRSRFADPWLFDDYTGDELLTITDSMAKADGYILNPAARTALVRYFTSVPRGEGFGNARISRNIVKQAQVRQSSRLITLPHRDATALATLVAADLAFSAPTHERAQHGDQVVAMALAQLDALIGLTEVKYDIQALVARQRLEKRRDAEGLPRLAGSNHLVFRGTPGTGKTTVAKIIAQIYGALGVVSRGHLVVTSRAGLVAGWVGQTAIKTEEIVRSALGGVLFVDEAYLLAGRDTHANDFGAEAVGTLLQMMEDHRDDLVVIVAGYPQQMDGFLDSNPGLRSRFDRTLDFVDYTDTELVAVFDSLLVAAGLTYEGDPQEVLSRCAELRHGEGFANARSVRQLLDRAVTSQAGRLAHDGTQHATTSELRTLITSDLA